MSANQTQASGFFPVGRRTKCQAKEAKEHSIVHQMCLRSHHGYPLVNGLQFAVENGPVEIGMIYSLKIIKSGDFP